MKQKRSQFIAISRAAACLLLIGPTLVVPANVWHAHDDCGGETCETVHVAIAADHDHAATEDANLCVGCVAATIVAETSATPVKIVIPATPERALVAVLTHIHQSSIPGITSRGPPISTHLI